MNCYRIGTPEDSIVPSLSSKEVQPDKSKSFFSKITQKCKEKSQVIKSLSENQSLIEIEIKEYVNHVDFNIGNEDEDEEEESPLAYFKFFNGKFKRVELLAKHLFAKPTTSVSSECLFSHAGLINSFLRNRLKPTTLEKLTFVKDNM